MKKYLSILIAIFCIQSTAWAACTKTVDTAGFDTWETDGNESDDVNECITAAAAGDTINVIAGDGAATWNANSVVIAAAKPLNIIGPGAGNLTITLGGSIAVWIYPYIGTDLLPAARISGFKFLSTGNNKYTAIRAQGQGWRIDHNTYECQSTTTGTAAFVEATGYNTTIEPYGLVDNNAVTNGKIINNGMLSFDKMSISWATPTDLGGVNSVYVEDNTFTGNKTIGGLWVDTNRGGKYVFRYNTSVHGGTLAHGLQDDEERGSKQWEIYGNSFSTNVYADSASSILAGTGTYFSNQFISTDPEHPFVGFVNFGHERYQTFAAVADAGACDGDSGWDENTTGKSGWLCRDQVGAGYDASAWAYPPTDNLPGPAQTHTPAYVWSILHGGSLQNPTIAATAATHIELNRDIYRHDTTNCPSNSDYATNTCSQGVGCGTLAYRPANCTTGTAYWATDQSNCADLTGYVGDSTQRTSGIATYLQGTLYKCTATNTWSAYYTPYQYPHPLRGEGGVTYYTLTITAPTHGTITTPEGINCGTGGSICSMEYESTDSAVLTFTADQEWRFSSASDDCAGTARGETCTLAMSAAKAAGATFVVQERVPWFKP